MKQAWRNKLLWWTKALGGAVLSLHQTMVWVVIVPLVLLLGFGYWLVGTSAGFEQVLHWLAADVKRRSQVSLTWEGVSGSLWQQASVDYVQWDAAGQRVEIRGLQWRFSRSISIKHQQLYLRQLQAAEVVVVPKQVQAPHWPASLRLPCAIYLPDLAVGRLRYGEQLLEQVQASLVLLSSQWDLQHARWRYLDADWQVKGRLSTQAPYPLLADVSATRPEQGRLQAQLNGDLAQMSLQADLKALGHDVPTLKVAANWQPFRQLWGPVAIDLAQFDPQQWLRHWPQGSWSGRMQLAPQVHPGIPLATAPDQAAVPIERIHAQPLTVIAAFTLKNAQPRPWVFKGRPLTDSGPVSPPPRGIPVQTLAMSGEYTLQPHPSRGVELTRAQWTIDHVTMLGGGRVSGSLAWRKDQQLSPLGPLEPNMAPSLMSLMVALDLQRVDLTPWLADAPTIQLHGPLRLDVLPTGQAKDQLRHGISPSKSFQASYQKLPLAHLLPHTMSFSFRCQACQAGPSQSHQGQGQGRAVGVNLLPSNIDLSMQSGLKLANQGGLLPSIEQIQDLRFLLETRRGAEVIELSLGPYAQIVNGASMQQQSGQAAVRRLQWRMQAIDLRVWSPLLRLFMLNGLKTVDDGRLDSTGSIDHLPDRDPRQWRALFNLQDPAVQQLVWQFELMVRAWKPSDQSAAAFARLQATGRGRLNGHQLDVAVERPDGSSLQASAHGKLHGSADGNPVVTWQGEWQQLHWRPVQAGVPSLRLLSPALWRWSSDGRFSLRDAGFELGARTTGGEGGHVALQELGLQRMAQGAWQLHSKGQFQQVNLAKWLSTGSHKDKAQAWLGHQTLQGSWQTEGDILQLTLHSEGQQPMIQGHASLGLSAFLQQPSHWRTTWSQLPVQAKLNVNIPDISTIPIATLLAKPSSQSKPWQAGEDWSSMQWRGRARMALEAVGPLAQPKVQGQLQGEDLAITVPAWGLLLDQGQAYVRVLDNVVKLERCRFRAPVQHPPPLSRHTSMIRTPAAVFQHQAGELSASGQWSFSQAGTPSPGDGLQLQLNKWPVMQRPDRWFMLSGRLALQTLPGQAADAGWQSLLQGGVVVDAGLFHMPKQQMTRLDEDVVLVDRSSNTTQAKTATTMMAMDVQIALSDQVYLAGNGLSTRLSGDLRIRRARDGLRSQPPLVTGSLRTVDGMYEAFGQVLAVERGIVTFNGPFDNPALNIRALRKGLNANQLHAFAKTQERILEVEAGVEITGTAKRPLVKLVSDPVVPDAEKLSWLVLGRGIERNANRSTGDTGALLAAATALLSDSPNGSGSSIGGVSRQLAQALGLDDIQLATGSLTGIDPRGVGSRVALAPGGGGSVLQPSASDPSLNQRIVSVSKTLGRQLELTVDQSVTTAANLFRLSWRMSQRFSLVARGGADNAVDGVYTVVLP